MNSIKKLSLPFCIMAIIVMPIKFIDTVQADMKSALVSKGKQSVMKPQSIKNCVSQSKTLSSKQSLVVQKKDAKLFLKESSVSNVVSLANKKHKKPVMKQQSIKNNISQPKDVVCAKPLPIVQKKDDKPLMLKEASAPKVTSLANVKEVKSKERTILVSNEITSDMITYKKHWTGNYTPSKFILMVNGQEVKQDAATPVKVTDDKLCVCFDYEFKVFGKVQRAGGRKFEYVVPPEIEKISSTFSWDVPANLVLNKGVLVASKDSSY